MIDQYIDNTVNKNISFYDKNLVGHASLADPICKKLFNQIKNHSNQSNHEIKFGGNYVGISGPSFSTRAESRMYKQLGGDLIGMTVPPEAKLAREVGLCYIGFALVTDFDSWDDSKPPVDVTTVEKNLLKMNNKMKNLLKDLISIFQLHEETEDNVSFQNNIVTDPKYRKNLKFNF
jgi:5'-methylthioadenosine phosphorylase